MKGDVPGQGFGVFLCMHPLMLKNLFQCRSVRWSQAQTPLDKLLTLCRRPKGKSKLYMFFVHFKQIVLLLYIMESKMMCIPGETFLLKKRQPFKISSSCSKGISPQTRSYSNTPSDHTVAERPWYLW